MKAISLENRRDYTMHVESETQAHVPKKDLAIFAWNVELRSNDGGFGTPDKQ